MIDLRSDTVTRPTPGMLSAMMGAQVGDDVFGDDPTVNELEQYAARLFGKESAIFCPSGTMTNQIAIRIHTQPQDEVICDKLSHIYLYEGGGPAYNSMVSLRLLEGDRGRLTPEMIAANVNPDDIHFASTRLVSLENTVNKGGGAYYPLAQMRAVSHKARELGLAMHLDGARVFNALVATGDRPADYGACFDTLSVCLSKGLGAPVGSLLIGSAALIKKARRVRKVLGGGMRQAGFLAAAGLYALQHQVARLADDHQRAQQLGNLVQGCPWVRSVMPIDTNIVIFEVDDFKKWIERMKAHGLHSVAFGPQHIRFVTHLDFTDDHLAQAEGILRKLG